MFLFADGFINSPISFSERQRNRGVRVFFVAALLVATLLLSGCADKAKALQLSANQFTIQALATVDAVDAVSKQEVAPSDRTDAERMKAFIGRAEAFEEITEENYNDLARIFTGSQSDAERNFQVYLDRLRQEFIAFGSMYQNLDKGYAFATEGVKKTPPVLEKRLSTVAAMAKTYMKKPAVFRTKRGELAGEIEYIKESATAQTKPLLLTNAAKRMQELGAQERAANALVLESSAKALELGSALQAQLKDYDKLSLNDLIGGVSTALGLASKISGRDFSGLEENINGKLKTLEDDPDTKNLIDATLGQISANRTILSGR